MSVGRVALVGAGPGDPALLTLRAAELLRTADVVAYDELVSEAILALVRSTAELLPVGRRSGKGTSTYRVHPDVLERARRGLFVVRLKAGDPFVFGRGGEEAEELAAARVPFEVVPGISAALGAAAYSAIPLTHRELSAQVVIASGHRGEGGAPPPAAVGGRTLVLYMASHELEANLAGVVAAGWPASTPAALVIAATTSDERTVVGTLATLAIRAQVADAGRATLPALVLIGDVVGLRSGIDWRARLPLRGVRVVVARAGSEGAELSCALRTFGGEVVELPLFDGETAVAPARWPSRVDLVVVSSASAARSLYARAPAHVAGARSVAKGHSSALEARRFGATNVICVDADTEAGFALAAVRVFVEPANARPLRDEPLLLHEVAP